MRPPIRLSGFQKQPIHEPPRGRWAASSKQAAVIPQRRPATGGLLANIVLLHQPAKSAAIVLVTWLFAACQSPTTDQPSETTYAQWHTVTLSFEGPATRESAEENPFLHYRLITTFTHEGASYRVPGFYAADGHADESGADAGHVWQVRFSPDAEGEWTYQVSFRRGDSLAVSDDPQAGKPVAFDGAEGTFRVAASNQNAAGFRAQGRLRYTGKRYLQFAETDEYFLKGGTDSPENLLGYQDFDGTVFGGQEEQREGEAAADKELHAYQDHVRDWHEGDPTWQGGKGKGLIGGLNYLADKGVNAIYFLTMNIEGDSKDVWPYTGYDERYRFDCSKLAQWERVFSHADSLRIMLHFVMQETENELLLDNGDLGPQRKLYYREMIARFAHHLAVTWNMGEENGYAEFTPKAQNTEQRKAMSSYFKETDPYRNFVVLHTHSARKHRYDILDALLGYQDLDGPSLQINPPSEVHAETRHWIAASAEAGKPWVVNLDEIGPHYNGALPDEIDPEHDTVRYESLWGNLMAGGGGVEWYFGYRYANSDLGLETWRTRNNLWDQTRFAVTFFHEHLPFWEMESADTLVTAQGAYCFAKPGEVYAIYLLPDSEATLDVGATEATYEVHWFDPKSGGKLQPGTSAEVSGSGKVSLGGPPSGASQDWVVLVQRK